MDFAAIRAKAEQAATAARAQLQRPNTPSRRASSSTTALPAAAAPPPSSRPTPRQATQQDKDALFFALDEFFSSRLGIQLTPAPARPNLAPKPARRTPIAHEPAAVEQQPSPAPAPKPSGPPPISRATRPHLSPALAPAAAPQHFNRSYPPAETHSSAALSLLHWLLDPPDLSSSVVATSTSPFFLPPPGSPSPQPPPLENRSDVRSAYSWLQRGNAKSYVGCFLFGDASIAWIRISWNVATEARGPTDFLRHVQREGRYRPRPRIEHEWDAERLYRASETYGPRIVRFAQDALARGVPVARGECWDLANEALIACGEADGRVPKPFPSIARTHGALLYYARADKGAKVLGTWTGGDVYVRPGDIVEWRSVTIREVGMAPGGYSTLGDPEHTAIIVAAGAPLTLPRFDPSGPQQQSPFLDPAYPLSSLVSLTVVEQSRGYAPSEKTYDLAAMSKGEVWIYRPCGLKDLVGVDEVTAKWPPEVQCWQIGEVK